MKNLLMLLVSICFLGTVLYADPLPQSQRINGIFVKKALQELTEQYNDSIVLISTLDNNPIAHGVIVKENGLILTKASELDKADFQVVLSNQKRYHGQLVGSDKSSDLALIKIKAEKLKPLTFDGDFPQQKATWLISPLFGMDSKIGIVSTVSRDIKRVSGVIGIMLGDEVEKGILISRAVEKGPAHSAGVKNGDILLKVDGKEMLQREKLLNYLKDKSPGTKVEIIVEQEGKEVKREILLGDRTQTFGMFNRNLEMSGTVSKRVDGFNKIIQHDIPLEHFDTGSPLLNIEGKVIGMNIAKANRSEAYALPNSEVRNALERLLKLKLPEEEKKFKEAKHVSLYELKNIQSNLQKLLPEVTKATVGLVINGASGSGIIVSEDGYVLTAAHVSQQPGSKVTIIMPDGKRYKGKSLGNHKRGDVGLVKITDKGKFPFVKMAKSADQKTGDWCFALGYPGGFNKERGAVVRIGKVIEIRPNVVWSDCTLLGGDSGGPLFNFKGEVFAINSRIYNTSEDNLHGPVDIIQDNWKEMAEGNAINMGRNLMNRAFLGVATEELDKGLKVVEVVEDSAAQKAGIGIGDVLLSIDDHELGSTNDLISLLRNKKVGDEINLNVLRNGSEVEIKATLKERP